MEPKQAKTYLSVKRQQVLQDKLQELGRLLDNPGAAQRIFVQILGMSRQELAEFRMDLHAVLEAAEVLPETDMGMDTDMDRQNGQAGAGGMIFSSHPVYKDDPLSIPAGTSY